MTSDVLKDFAERIPLNDPEQALAFCQSLRSALSDQEQQPKAPVTLSIVVPLYNEADNLEELYNRLGQVLESTGVTYEIIFVDDGSNDRSNAIYRQLLASDTHNLKVLRLSRNFGHQAAFCAGIDHATGEAVILMDGDLQDPPEVIPQFLEAWQKGSAVVYAVREERKEGPLKKFLYFAYYRILSILADIEIPLDAGDFSLMDRKVVDCLKAMPERNRFLRGIRSWVGFKQTSIPFERNARSAGVTKYSWHKLFRLALNGIVSFSNMPLRLISVSGAAVSLLSVTLTIFYAVKKTLYGLEPPGFATLVVMISFFAGLQLLTLGIIGEYLGRVLSEVKNRPLYVVRNISTRESACES
jgi:dolichol-phosphate mannosyltransferase